MNEHTILDMYNVYSKMYIVRLYIFFGLDYFLCVLIFILISLSIVIIRLYWYSIRSIKVCLFLLCSGILWIKWCEVCYFIIHMNNNVPRCISFDCFFWFLVCQLCLGVISILVSCHLFYHYYCTLELCVY